MPPVHFKFTKSDGHTRRVTFQALPTWTQLASKLQALYGIPIDKVGVSYIDNDNDEITASSNEELQDFYQTSHESGQVVKFSVLDLAVPRETAPSQLSNPSRNTFGQDNFDFPDSDWQPLGAFAVADFLDSTSEGLHAFVEVINSDVSSFAKNPETDSEDGQSTIQPTVIDKGKRKASSLGAASVVSVVDEESSEKFPVHVLDHASTNEPPTEPLVSITADSHPYIPAQSTPKAQAEALKAQETPSSEPNHVEDPPLPSFDTPSQSNASATLSHDLATLLNTLHTVISFHPELSQGVRSIVRNAANGSYWQAHRSALSQASEDLHQPAERFEEDAARRVSEALGNFFRSISLFTPNDEQNPPREPTASTHEHREPHWSQSPLSSRWPWYRRHTSMYDTSMNHQQWAPHWHNPSWPFERSPSGPPPPSGAPLAPGAPPPPATHLPRGPPPPPPLNPPSLLPSGDPIPAPPPPPLGPAPYNIPAHISPLHDPAQQPALPPIPPVPLSSRLGPHYGHHGHRFRNGYPPHLNNYYYRPPPPPPVEVTTTAANAPLEDRGSLPEVAPNSRDVPSQDRASRPTAQQLRSQVEEARRIYKAQKEVYRREREERRKAKTGHDIDNSVASTRPAENGRPSQIVSNAWGSYPQLEIYSAGAPRRHNTHPGHGSSRRGEGKSENLNMRAQSRIARRLADMGFSEHSHPNLSEKIKAQMPGNKVISKEQEDDIVTTLLEELLAQSAKSPVASGSGSKAEVIPGEWDL